MRACDLKWSGPLAMLTLTSVHASDAVLARASIRLAQPVDVDVMGERRQCRLGHLARQFRYPLEFRGYGYGGRCLRTEDHDRA